MRKDVGGLRGNGWTSGRSRNDGRGMGGGWTWLLIDVVGVAILGVFLFYGQRQSARWRGEQTSARSKALAGAAVVGAAALTVFLITDAARRIYDLGPAGETPGDLAHPTVPTEQERAAAERTGEPAKEATCRTTPGEKQAGMSHEACVFIASQIPVMASNTGNESRTGKTVPSPSLAPGADVPQDVAERKPLPSSVTDKLPDLRDFRYFLAGQDIVVVGRDGKIAFVVNVKVRP